MPMPPVQQPVYGDRTKLEKLGSMRMTNNPAADVQVIKDMAGGRPTKRTPLNPDEIARQAVLGQQAAARQPVGIDPGHAQHFQQVALLQALAEKWVRIASQPEAGPVTKGYAIAALRSWRQALEQTRSGTPFFSDIMG
jgi:hypothetical protein